MDDTNNTTPTNGKQSNRRLEQTSSSHIPFNETSARTAERTCTQKLSIPSLQKYDSSSANLWWREFVQYVKMTKDIDISPIVNSEKKTTTVSRTIGNRNKGHIPMGNQTKRTHRNDKDGKRKRTELPSTTQIIHPISTTLYTWTDRTTQPVRLLRPKKKKRRISSRCLEKNPRSRKELRVRKNYSCRSTSIKIPITHRKIDRRL